MKITLLCIFTLFISRSLYCQSTLVYAAGATIAIGTGADVCADLITVNGTYSGSGHFCNGPLPVELVSLTAKEVQNKIELVWQTATEINTDGFEIERTSGNAGWIKIGFVRGAGNSNVPRGYSFTDKNYVNGKYSYHLKQIDRDGKFEYSKQVEIIASGMPKDFILGQNYPNPFNPGTVISYQLPQAAFVSVKVYDVLGREVADIVSEPMEAGAHAVSFDASKLSSGLYYYTLQAGAFAATRSMVLMK